MPETPEQCTAEHDFDNTPGSNAPVLTCILNAGHRGTHLDATYRLCWEEDDA